VTDGVDPMNYSVIIENSTEGFGAYIPDLPGCVAAGESKDEVVRLIQDAVVLHLDGLNEEGQPIPESSTTIEIIEFSA